MELLPLHLSDLLQLRETRATSGCGWSRPVIGASRGVLLLSDKHDHRRLSVGTLLDEHNLAVAVKSTPSAANHHTLPCKRLLTSSAANHHTLPTERLLVAAAGSRWPLMHRLLLLDDDTSDLSLLLLLLHSPAPADEDNDHYAEDAAAYRRKHGDQDTRGGVIIVSTASTSARAVTADITVALVVGSAREARASV